MGTVPAVVRGDISRLGLGPTAGLQGHPSSAERTRILGHVETSVPAAQAAESDRQASWAPMAERYWLRRGLMVSPAMTLTAFDGAHQGLRGMGPR